MPRVDIALVDRGLAASRSAARRLIADGAVRIGEGPASRRIERASQRVEDGDVLTVAESVETRYVSRAGAKLDAALERLALDVRGLTALDVGMSTGGFADCLLARGAARVVGVDVGHGQLHPRLRADPRVRSFENVNARELTPATLGDAMPAGGFALIVADVSFISLTQVLPALGPLLAADGRLLALVKPQFEAGPGGVDRRGLADPTEYPRVEARIRGAIAELGWQVRDWFESALTGGDGNREFFVHATALPAVQGRVPGR